MQKSKDSSARTERLDLQFPDWSGMDDSTRRVEFQVALEYCERFRRWFPELSNRAQSQRVPKCTVEFVLQTQTNLYRGSATAPVPQV